MTHPDRLVVKVGGSLYDHPKLKDGLKAWLAARPEKFLRVVPGGGEFAEAVRRLDTVHGLGEKAAHRIAMIALRPASAFVADILGVERWAGTDKRWWTESGTVVIQHENFETCYWFEHPQSLPQTWEFTTDSLAACAAHDAGCGLVLLKSLDIPPAMTWEQAADRGYVDAYFPTLVARHGLSVTAVNFRRVLDAY